MDWRVTLPNLFARADALHDRAQARLALLRPSHRSAFIVPYIGFGTPQRLLVSGRVLRGRPMLPALPGDTGLRNLLRFYRQMASHEMPGARMTVAFGGTEQQVVADEEGYFHAEIEPASPLPPGPWQQVALRLEQPEAHGVAQVRVPPATARFGIISDIDDTVVWTHASRRLKMLLTVARGNPHTRRPLAGVGALYRALQAGAGGNECNPIFYVSSSPWNLYPPLLEFLDLQRIPTGPLLLKDFGDHTLFALRDHHTHKLASIERILEIHPSLPFVLIGDSGEQDPEIYREVVHRYPQRVRAIYIRQVAPDAARLAALDRLIGEVSESGAQLVLVPDSEFAAAHAAAEGLIDPARLTEVRAETRAQA
ncbi:App1 family protein [Caldimonas tepidiphila]|uniref:App1 family protein n=1 Tax=Caldimonas tepidiphila TaxID=2315841 RepID=UPI001300288C|nr:phosphatase domain-containing protein [Caldimonas tepidiphila]